MSAPELVTVTIDGVEVRVPKGAGLVETAAAADLEARYTDDDLERLIRAKGIDERKPS